MKYLKFNSEKCDGNGACEKVCANTFFKREDKQYSAIHIDKTEAVYTMNSCNQCGECIEICPVKAISRNKAGIVTINKDLCVGCFMCVGFCPTEAMRRTEEQTVPFKCISCGICVKACPNDALSFEEADHSALPQ